MVYVDSVEMRLTINRSSAKKWLHAVATDTSSPNPCLNTGKLVIPLANPATKMKNVMRFGSESDGESEGEEGSMSISHT